MWQRAFQGTHITPPVLHAMRIRDVAIAFGADIGPPASRVSIPDDQAVADAPGGPRLRTVD